MTQSAIRGYPLSGQQARIWALDQGGTALVSQCALLLAGPVEADRLERAVGRVFGRHEILRTTFQRPKGLRVPVQVVADESALTLRVLHVAEAGPGSETEIVERLVQADRKVPFESDQSVPIRLTLVEVGEQRSVLVITASSLVMDLGSLHLISDEVAQAYGADSGVDPSEEEPLQYASYAAWQAEILEDDDAKPGRAYWRSQDVREVLGAYHPLARTALPEAAFVPKGLSITLGAPIAEAVSSLARDRGVEASVVYLSCWRALLGRLVGDSELAVGLRVHGRLDEELELAMGPFAGFVPLRSSASVTEPFETTVDHVSGGLSRGRDWEPYFLWEDVIDGPDSDSAFLPFAFEFQSSPARRTAAGVTFSVLYQEECADRFQLKLSCAPSEDEVAVTLQYDSSVLDRADTERLAEQYRRALSGVLADPSAPFEAIDILGDEERASTVVDFNASGTAVPSDVCVHELFETQARRVPDRLAVVDEHGSITYRALHVRANDLAVRLRGLGVTADSTVCLHLPRSIDAVVGMLGVMKAGGAYVPLDPAMPRRRLEMLISESGARVVVTDARGADEVSDANADVLVLDEVEASQDELLSGERPRATPANLAYVIFTSGTTGRPKGVLVEHRQLANYVRGVSERLGINEGEHFATVSTFAADLGNTVIFASLCTGGSLHVISEARRSDPDAVAEYLERHPIDAMKIVPSHLEALLAARRPERVLSVRRLVVGGEASRRDLVERLEALSPDCQIFNHYGPTETTVGATTHTHLAVEQEALSGTLPLGTPLPGYSAYLLNDTGLPAPIGVVGEAYIGGLGVARGYLSRAAETAERFVPDPFGAEGARLYRTGDLLRHLPSGTLEFRGRVDHQIKIRGYRVEQAEVEALLQEHEAVAGVAVVADSDAHGSARLVAYYVSRPDASLSADDLRAHAKLMLPDYMVPAVFMSLQALPLDPNGKLDRQALPEPDEGGERAASVPPGTPAEIALAEIWTELLKIEEIGIHDDFFDLGGHSLSAMQLVSRVRQSFDVDLPLLTIFEVPTIAGLVASIAAAPSSGGEGVPSLEPVARGQAIPASFAQERLWLFDQLQPGNPAYNVPWAVRIEGALDATAFGQAIAALVARHEVLRTTFSAVDGRAVQVIQEVETARIPLVDLRGVADPARSSCVERLAAADATRPFDLESGPVWRSTLIRLADEEHVVLWNQHHISSDAWSAGVFVREFSALFDAFTGGVPSSLEPLAIQYADFSHWQRQWLESTAVDDQVEYWKETLGGAPPALTLPVDHARPRRPTFRGGAESVLLSPELSAGIVALGREENATTFVTFLAALNALLYLHTGQADIVIGSPVAGRTQAETEGLIGFFLNSLALRTRVQSGESFRELMHNVRSSALSAFANQDLPFERVVEELGVERDPSRSVLYQVMFNLQKAPEGRLDFGGLTLSALGSSESTSKFDLTLYATEGPEQTSLRLVYNADIFEASTASSMLARLVRLLEAVVEQPDRPIAGLPLLSAEERASIDAPVQPVSLPAGFVSGDPAASGETVTECFAEQVSRHPDRLAVKTPSHEWSYQRLDQEATAVAARVEELVGDEGARIGLLFQSDAPLFAAMLGVLKAGQAYVPLDPANPKDRLIGILEDAGVTVLLTDDANLDFAGEMSEGVEFVLSTEAAGPSRPFSGVRSVTPETPAYILYTSGSTGRPKGVVQSQGNLRNLIRTYSNNLRIQASDRLSLLSSYAFDGAVMDIYGALLNGATLVPTQLMEEGLEGTLERLGDEGVTVYHSTPTVFRQLFGQARETPVATDRVRAVVLGGEEALASDLSLFKDHFSPGATLVNGLGPSESTLALQQMFTHESVVTRSALPVGRAVDETEVLLIDPAGARTDLFGEIVIRSPHIALGYWGDEEKTAASFGGSEVPRGRRTYKTGDLGRVLPDGILEFVGRKDSQVKIRGFRIELGEVESVLAAHPSVQECAVLARTREDGRMALVAYVQPTEVEATVAEVRAYLKEKLPDYMVPADFSVQEQLPLTPNGKLDRAALPALELTAVSVIDFIEPATPIEVRVAELWVGLLGVVRVGRFDDFFGLGGHSLLAMQLVSRLRKVFEIEMPLRVLFETSTLTGMSLYIEDVLGDQGGALQVLSPIERIDRSEPLPLSFAQQRMWILDQLEPGRSTYNVPFAVDLLGPLDLAALRQAFAEIMARHEVLRTTFGRSEKGDPVLLAHEQGDWALSFVDLISLSTDQKESVLAELARSEARRPFDLELGPLVRGTVVRVTPSEHAVLLTMHHIVSDAWSTGILVRELSELYGAFASGERSTLAELPVQYADYSAWQQGWLQGDVLQEQLEFWTTALENAPELTSLPTDRARVPNAAGRAARVGFELPEDLTRSLSELARSEGTTLFVSLLAVFQVLLHKYTGQNDVVVGTPVAGRTSSESEGLIGFFVNTLVLRSKIRPDSTFRSLLSEVQEVVLGATEHQDLPFERLVDELQPSRDGGHSPLFQVAFALNNAPRADLEMSELALRGRPVEAGSPKFDWSMLLNEVDGAVSGNLEYDVDLFDVGTVEQVVRHYEALLASAVASPDRALAGMGLLSEAETDVVLGEWSGVGGQAFDVASIPERFEAQATRTPDAVALVFGDTQLSYRTLDRRANGLARQLRERGVGPESLVGLCVDRSDEMMVSVLAILKAGGAYVPLAPDQPMERLAFMIGDAGLDLLLAGEDVIDRLPPVSVDVLDPASMAGPREQACRPSTAPDLDNTAYVIYTSGSTGRPKGTPVTHRNVSRLLSATESSFNFGSDDVWTLFHSYAFDFSVWEMWGALCYGGRLIVVPYVTSRSPADFVAMVESERVTVLNQTPSAFRQFVAAEERRTTRTEANPLRYIVFGGEALDVHQLSPWIQHHGSARPQLINMYGITETTVHVTHRRVTEDDLKDDRSDSPIGRPIPDLRVFVQDPLGNLVPGGVSGELFVGGGGVARGYLGLPSLTAERFLPDPFGEEPGARVYRTGDLARWRSNGTLGFVGRADHQVKIRGFRIELGEVQSVLEQCEGVRDAVVLAASEGRDAEHLIAYVTAEGDPPSDGELRSHARMYLPEYMVPSAFVRIESLPLTANGKLDVKALPQPARERHDPLDAFSAPSTETEVAIAALWREVLLVDEISVDDKFFDLGGHSLNAVQVMTRAEGELGLKINFDDLVFQTLRQIAAAFET